MTREEAIADIRDNIKPVVGGISLDMAIEALEQEPCEDWYDVPSNEMTLEQARQAVKDLREKLAEYLEQQPCEDDVSKFISRQVSLLEERMSSATSEGRWVEEEKCQCAIENLELVDEYIKAHPPVTPKEKEKTGKWIDEADKIDAQFGKHTYKCSECGKYAEYFVSGTEVWWDRIKPNYCPNCGIKMVEP